MTLQGFAVFFLKVFFLDIIPNLKLKTSTPKFFNDICLQTFGERISEHFFPVANIILIERKFSIN